MSLRSCCARRLCWNCSTTQPFWTPASRFSRFDQLPSRHRKLKSLQLSSRSYRIWLAFITSAVWDLKKRESDLVWYRVGRRVRVLSSVGQNWIRDHPFSMCTEILKNLPPPCMHVYFLHPSTCVHTLDTPQSDRMVYLLPAALCQLVWWI